MSAFSIFRSAALPFAIMLAAVHVRALNPERGLAQYLRDEWGPSKGYTGGSVYGFAQTADGFLWIAGENGVVRFDGITFSPLAIPQSAAVEGSTVLGTAVSDDGALWLRMRGRTLVGYRDGAFVDEMAAHGQRAGTISAMSSQSRGGILIGGYGHGVIRFSRGRVEPVVPPDMMPDAPVISIAETDRGVWLGTRDAGLFRFTGALGHVDGLPADEKINCLLPDPSGDVWIGTDRGLARWTPRGIVRVALPDRRSVAVFSLLRDRESNVWVAAGARGVIRINTAGAASFGDWDARSNGVATALFEDRERNVWIGTTRGIVRMRDGVFATYSGFANLPSDQVGAIHVDAKGRTWFAPTRGGLYWLDGDRPRAITVAGLDRDVVYSLDGRGDDLWIGRQYGGLTHIQQAEGRNIATRYTERNGLAQDSVFAVHASADGTVWAGTLSGGVSHVHAGTFDNYTVRNGLASNAVTAIAESGDGDMWFGSPEGLTRYDGKRWRPYTTSDGLPSSTITALAIDRGGTLWIGTASGLAMFRGPGTVIEAVPTVRDPVVGLAEDRSGWLWCATTDRLVRLSAAGDMREYDAADGLIGRQGVNRHRTLIADARGRIWYATNDGLSVADPARFEAPTSSVPLRISAVSVTRRRVVLSYTAVSLSIPERIRYRYHLDGFDREWSAPSAERTATYTNLAPAHYVFRVLASDGSGPWSGSDQSLAFDIQPAFWETMPFRFGALLVLISAIWAVYRVRMAQLSRELHVRFEERLTERNRIAQELHDTLLQGLLSASMQLHVATSRVPEDSPARSQLSSVLELMKRVIDEGRSAIRGLRSASNGGDDLRSALAGAARDLGVEETARIAVTVDGSPQAVHPFVRDEVYRVGREALVNAIRHAQARTIDIALDYRPDALVLTVSDDGIGIDEEIAAAGREGHWGLSGMRERADSVGGRLSVRSRAGAGTQVELSIPGAVAYHESGRPPFRRQW